MAGVAADQDRVFAIYGQWDGDELDNAGRRWLNEHGYRAWDAWFGPTQLVVYGLSPEPGQAEVQVLGAEFGQSIILEGYSLEYGAAEAGSLLNLTLHWQARQPVGQNYKVFVHLLDRDGRLVAQRDSEPVGGSRPATTWRAGEPITDQVGLLLPPDLEPGEYELLVGMYDPETLERLPLVNAAGEVVDDSVPLDSVLIPASQP
jgi:hypothetical protein